MNCPNEKNDSKLLPKWIDAYRSGEEFLVKVRALDPLMAKLADAIEPLIDGIAHGVCLLLDHRDGECPCKKCPAKAQVGGHGFTFLA